MIGFRILIAVLLLLKSTLSNDTQCPITLSNGGDRRTHPDKL